MIDLAISTAAFCLWDIGPAQKMNICKRLGFNRIVIAFSTLKMLRQFASSVTLCKMLAQFDHVMIHAPWCDVRYKENNATKETFAYLHKIIERVQIEAVIFHFECIKDWSCFEGINFPFYVKNPNQASWKTFDEAMHKHDFSSVLDINRAVRYENYIDNYLMDYSEQIKAIHVSGFIEELGRTPIIESGQVEVLDKVRQIKVPIVIEGLFSPGDFEGIREEVQVIQKSLLG